MSQILFGAARGVAFCLGLFALLNILGECCSPGFDANLWWIDTRPLPAIWSRAWIGMSASLMIAAAIRPGCSPFLSWLTRAAIVSLLTVAVRNSIQFWCLLDREEIVSDFPVPFSGLLSAALTALVAIPWMGHRCSGWTRGSVAAAISAGVFVLIGVPVAQMVCFGTTDYRRPADAAVVFGAKCYASGRPSLVLADRTETACELYRAGLVRKLILSGGPGDGAVHEVEAMRRIAHHRGIPDADLILDFKGLNTQATVETAVRNGRQNGFHRILAVSHFYHLPRIKLTFHRAGREVYTVPARQSRRLHYLAWYMAREVAALWSYYARPLAQP